MSEDLEGEIWKDVEGYEDLYQVSNMGRFKRDHILKTVLQPTGYLNICLCKNCFKSSRKEKGAAPQCPICGLEIQKGGAILIKFQQNEN